ncbi:S26 family signal peptidase [Acidovorax sp. NPDC077693]|uniref:S26 family signal peptidase n=1 Tax=unclassified Acidovorax TaxID=2684926 RepID=UPI0037C5E603
MTQPAVPLPMLLAGMATAVALVVGPMLVPREPRFVYNPSASVAPGWYHIERMERADFLHVGSIVLVRLPADVAALAAQRGYLPSGVPILKRVGALAPQSVCVHEQTVRIDDAVVAGVRLQDGMVRPLQAWGQCRALVEGEIFLLSDTHPASFDSRYFGPVQVSAVLGIAHPLWIWSAP